MSRHVIENDTTRWIFGWNQYIRSFFLQRYDKTLRSDDKLIFHVGVRPYEIPTSHGLITLALLTGLDLPHEVRGQVEQDEQDEEREYFVLHWPGDFVNGFRTDSMAQAETLRAELTELRPDQELQIRRVTMFKDAP